MRRKEDGGLPPDVIDLSEAIGLSTAAKRMRGRGGKAPSVETVRRWSNPKRGCHPQGKDGPRLVLATIRMSGELLTLPEWVDAFERARERLGRRGLPQLDRGLSDHGLKEKPPECAGDPTRRPRPAC